MGAPQTRDFYFDPHTKHYTGMQNVLKGWCANIRWAANRRAPHYKLLGSLCLVYGGFILLLTAIPNRFNGRLAFLFCGGMMFGVGWVLFGTGKR